MNNYKRLCHCVCSTGSGRERSCEEQNIGAQCGTTTTNTATETVEQSENIVIQPKQLKQLNSQNLKRQLEVVPSPADVCQADSNGYPAAHVPSKVPRWRRPPYLNICCTSSSTQQSPLTWLRWMSWPSSTLCLIQLSWNRRISWHLNILVKMCSGRVFDIFK